MADIAVAAALGVVQIFLSQREPESNPKIDIIKGDLETMRAYLKDTEQREQDTEGAKDRRNKVREIAYEIEDALEEFMVDVPEHFHEHIITKALHDISHKVIEWLALHKLSTRMKHIQDQINAIKKLGPFRTPSSGVASSSSAGGVPDLAYPILNNDELVGMKRRIRDLLDLLIKEESKRLVISVVGPSGSGKTTLIKKVCESERVKGHFECHAWVPHSTSCKDPWEKMCKEMGVPGANMEQNLVNYLQQRRYLVVLDGVWSDDWCNIIKKLPDNGNGSRIIISTYRRDLAAECSGDIYDLDLLTGKEAWELFCKGAFRDGECPERLREVSEDLLSRCGGLPYLIVALGSLLSTKHETPAEFQKVNASLGSNMESNSKLGIIRRVLQQRYFHLSHNLRRCFLHFCQFPEGYSVTRGRLIRLWIAEGFVEKERGKTLEEVANAYLDELINGYLVDANKRDFQGIVRSCQVNNLVREFLVSLSEDERFCKVLTTTENVDRYDHLTHRRIAIHDAFTNSLQSKDFSRVRTLFMFGRENFTTSMFGKALERFKLLRVLELKDAPLETFPKEVVTLALLRYLNLRNTKIKAVPSSVEKLQNLETLDLRQTLVAKLPKTIHKLHRLVYLLVDHQRDGGQARVGAELFSGIGVLSSLQKLSLVKANKNQGIAKELGNLTAMRKLRISELERMDGKDLCASIQKMEHLSSLHVTSISKEEVLDLGHLSAPPSSLHKLSLGGKLRETPSWISKLNSLVKMSLKSSGLDGRLIEALQALPCLMELQLVDAFNGEVLEFRCNWFQELRMLEVEQSDQLHMVVTHEGAMPKLQKLTMRRCKNLKLAPLGLNNLTTLEEMYLYEMPEELITELDNIRTGEYQWMIDHIQVIHTSCSPANRTCPARFRNLSSFASY